DRVGPLGIAFPSDGTVLVTDHLGNMRRFPNNRDGQSANNATLVQNYGRYNAVDMTRMGGAIYMTQQTNGTVGQLNQDGTFGSTIVRGIPQATGLTQDPRLGYLYVSSDAGFIARVDVANRTWTTFASNVFADGLAASLTSNVLYAALADRVVGYNLLSGALVFDSGFIAGVPDGIALGAGVLAGNLYVNTIDGTLVELNL